jgi:hypothetical protein
MNNVQQPAFETTVTSKEQLVNLLERNLVKCVDQMSALFDFIESNKWSTSFHVKAFWVYSTIHVHITNADGLIIGFVERKPAQQGL